MTKEGGGTEDIKKRLSKARGPYSNLIKIWNTRSTGRNTKIKLFKTLVRPVPLYVCEAWKLHVTAAEKKLGGFQFSCLRRDSKNSVAATHSKRHNFPSNRRKEDQ